MRKKKIGIKEKDKKKERKGKKKKEGRRITPLPALDRVVYLPPESREPPVQLKFPS